MASAERRRRNRGQATLEYVLGAGLLMIGAIAAYQMLDLGNVMASFIASSNGGTVNASRIDVQMPGASVVSP